LRRGRADTVREVLLPPTVRHQCLESSGCSDGRHVAVLTQHVERSGRDGCGKDLLGIGATDLRASPVPDIGKAAAGDPRELGNGRPVKASFTESPEVSTGGCSIDVHGFEATVGALAVSPGGVAGSAHTSLEEAT